MSIRHKELKMNKRVMLKTAGISSGLVLIAVGGGYAYSATTTPTATCTNHPAITANATAKTQNFTIKCSVPYPSQAPATVTATATATQTVTVTPSPTDSTSPSPTDTPTTETPSPTATATSGTWSETVPFGSASKGYHYSKIPNSNGYNTYVSNQSVGPQSGTDQTAYVNDPGDWILKANDVPYGYEGVQSFANVQQLFNNWGTGGWNGSDDTPIDALSTLKVHYTEESPTSANSIYEFAVDLWLDNYNSDIMFWVDTHQRDNNGAWGDTILGHTTIDGQNWTVHRYGGAGDEIIFVLDGAGGPGTAARQSSGTINVKAGVDWLVANGYVGAGSKIGQMNTGWEICSADNQTFRMTDYSIEATVK